MLWTMMAVSIGYGDDYGCKEGQANVGLEVDPAQQARMIRGSRGDR